MTEMKDTLVIYLGTGPAGVMLLPLETFKDCKSEKECVEKASNFNLKRGQAPRVIGAVYNVGALPNLATIRMPFKWSNDGTIEANIPSNWVAAWQVAERAHKVKVRAEKEEIELSKDSKMDEALKTIRKRYHSTDRIGRLALEVVLLDHLRNKI